MNKAEGDHGSVLTHDKYTIGAIRPCLYCSQPIRLINVTYSNSDWTTQIKVDPKIEAFYTLGVHDSDFTNYGWREHQCPTSHPVTEQEAKQHNMPVKAKE